MLLMRHLLKVRVANRDLRSRLLWTRQLTNQEDLRL
jgi:hypothetical protein